MITQSVRRRVRGGESDITPARELLGLAPDHIVLPVPGMRHDDQRTPVTGGRIVSDVRLTRGGRQRDGRETRYALQSLGQWRRSRSVLFISRCDLSSSLGAGEAEGGDSSLERLAVVRIWLARQA